MAFRSESDNVNSTYTRAVWLILNRLIAKAYMYVWYKYLTVSLVFSHLGFWSGNLFLIAPFPDLCLLVPFYIYVWFDLKHLS